MNKQSETVGCCLVLAILGVVWIGFAFLAFMALLLETDGWRSWSISTWLFLVVPVFVVAPILFWLGFVQILKLGDEDAPP